MTPIAVDEATAAAMVSFAEAAMHVLTRGLNLLPEGGRVATAAAMQGGGEVEMRFCPNTGALRVVMIDLEGKEAELFAWRGDGTPREGADKPPTVP